jgi:hypothetical protein
LDLSEAPVGWSLSAPSWKFNKNDSSKLRPGGVAVPFWPVATEVALRGFEVVPNDLPAMTCEVMRYEGGKAGELIELWDRTLRSHPDWNQRQLGTYNARCHAAPLAFPSLGDRTSAWRITMEASARGEQGRIITDEIYIRVGDLLARFAQMAQVGEVPDAALSARLATRLAERMAAVASRRG